MNLVNAVLFKVNWIACVIGGAYWGLLGITGLALYSWLRGSWRKDLPLAALLATVGALLDTLWIQVGILDYGTTLAPIWIVLLWVGLAMTLHHAMAIFQRRPVLGAVLAGGCAPITYLSGQALGAVVVPQPWLLPVIAIAWGVLFFWLFKRLGAQESADTHVGGEAAVVGTSTNQQNSPVF